MKLYIHSRSRVIDTLVHELRLVNEHLDHEPSDTHALGTRYGLTIALDLLGKEEKR